jgi:hypothetical protein
MDTQNMSEHDVEEGRRQLVANDDMATRFSNDAFTLKYHGNCAKRRSDPQLLLADLRMHSINDVNIETDV